MIKSIFKNMRDTMENIENLKLRDLQSISPSSISTANTAIASPTSSIISRCFSSSSNQEPKKIKLKKDALEYVDFLKEYQSDPKYKTEMCKSFSENGFCPYGNKCRFAHGRHELFDKLISCKKYKQKECLSFFKNKFCNYGSRCHFKHLENKLSQINRSYYTLLLTNFNTFNEKDIIDLSEESLIDLIKSITPKNRESAKVKSPENNLDKAKKYLNSLETINLQRKFSFNYNDMMTYSNFTM